MALTVFVEGDLDAQILRPFLEGLGLTVRRGGSKNALPHEVRRQKDGAVYVRDRDFDADPPTDTDRPVMQRDEAGRPLGWTWARHEIENYLIEPAVFATALGVEADDWAAALRASAAGIRGYQAARWAIGTARRLLPPHYRLQTYPKACKKDFKLPEDLSPHRQSEWVAEHAGAFRARVEPALADRAIRDSFDGWLARFDDALIADIPRILVWFSGKDLMGACRAWFEQRGLGGPEAVRQRVRDVSIERPGLIAEHVPEWVALREAIGTLPG